MTRSLLLVTLAVAACADQPRGETPAPDAPTPAPVSSWQATPEGASLTTRADTLRITTGPHVVSWDPASLELAPPYRVSATLQKHSGRLHEGFGLVFGGSGLEGPEAGQVYSYFLVRGDGSFLIKKRQGTATPVVRDWTRHPAIRRDADDSGRPNDLVVAVTDTTVTFSVNGAAVAQVPASELSVAGRAGVRSSHDLELSVVGFQAGQP